MPSETVGWIKKVAAESELWVVLWEIWRDARTIELEDLKQNLLEPDTDKDLRSS